MTIIKKKIISHYLQFPKENIYKVAEMLKVSSSMVSSVITDYYRDLHIFKPLYFCFSLLGENEGYLFDDICERSVIISQKEIQNKEIFTQYELDWLRINYNLK